MHSNRGKWPRKNSISQRSFQDINILIKGLFNKHFFEIIGIAESLGGENMCEGFNINSGRFA
jgi:hypothetical protein